MDILYSKTAIPFSCCRNCQTNAANPRHTWRKCFGVFCLSIEVLLIGGNIFGFTALYSVLAEQGIYENYCSGSAAINSTSTGETSCLGQTEKYEVGCRNHLNFTTKCWSLFRMHWHWALAYIVSYHYFSVYLSINSVIDLRSSSQCKSVATFVHNTYRCPSKSLSCHRLVGIGSDQTW